MARALKVAVAGLGTAGQAVVRAILQTPGLKLVAAVDPAPLHAGKDLAAVLGLPRRLGIKVESQPEKFLKKVRVDVAFVCTSSFLKEVKPAIVALASRRTHVLTTCEELAYPVPERLAAFREIDRIARAKKVTVLATGLNPGFAMDTLALALTAPCARVRRVSVTRVVEAGQRRLPLQRRVCAGLNMIAGGLGWKLDRVDETLEPAIAPRDLDTEYLRISAGAAAGIRQGVRAYRGAELAVSLDLQIYVGAESPRAHVLVDGDPPVDATIAGGVSGDVATAALLVNSLPRLLNAAPGLRTAKDLPLVHCLNPQELMSTPPRKR
jgi:2,4-diaminopentanoate dehydrogenase